MSENEKPKVISMEERAKEELRKKARDDLRAENQGKKIDIQTLDADRKRALSEKWMQKAGLTQEGGMKEILQKLGDPKDNESFVAAVTAIQKKYKLTPDGVLGWKTLEKMEQEFEATKTEHYEVDTNETFLERSEYRAQREKKEKEEKKEKMLTDANSPEYRDNLNSALNGTSNDLPEGVSVSDGMVIMKTDQISATWNKDRGVFEGTITYDNGTYTGEIVDGTENGTGEYIDKEDGKIYRGTFKEGDIVRGKMEDTSRNWVWEGDFVSGEPFGEGTWNLRGDNRIITGFYNGVSYEGFKTIRDNGRITEEETLGSEGEVFALLKKYPKTPKIEYNGYYYTPEQSNTGPVIVKTKKDGGGIERYEYANNAWKKVGNDSGTSV